MRKASYVRGKRLRATRLNSTGSPVTGSNSSVITKGFITVGMTTNVEEGEAVSQQNANGETCVLEQGTPTFTGFGIEIEFCEVDFVLFEMLTGQKIVLGEGGQPIGITESTNIDLSKVNFALEMWLGADTKGTALRDGADGHWGYILLPYISGGVVGDVTVENGAVNFTISNSNTKDGSQWGAGPYNVELIAGTPGPLRTPITSRDHRRIMNVEVAPPEIPSTP